MFNSTIVDVAIGMIFVYLLLSLMCSAVNESIELLLKKRAIDLERGIRELLSPGSKSGGNDIVQKLYDHSLVNNLFGGKYSDSGIASRLRVLMRTKLPSYIPARNFALALMDLVGTPAAATAGAAPPPSSASGATPPSAANLEVKLAAPPPQPPPPGSAGNPLTPLRNAIATTNLFAGETERVRTALIALVDAAEDDVAKARENIEGWFNSSMDRVSSWYKRRTQVIILILGLFVAVTVNADSIAIVKKLSSDKALRDSLVDAARAYADANAKPNTTASPVASPVASPIQSAPSSTSTSPVASPGALPLASPTASPLQSASPIASPSPPTSPSPKGSPSASPLPTPESCGKDPNSAQCKYDANQQQILNLGLPLGWQEQGETWPAWDLELWWKQLMSHGIGWLLTAFAISLGAPFWFDLLNKFIVIRSAVKPHEKSPEEESKD